MKNSNPVSFPIW